MRSYTHREFEAQPSRLVLWLCCAILLLVSSVQACHICGLGVLDFSQASLSETQSVTNSGGICLICITSQPATHPVPALRLDPDFSSAEKSVAPSTISDLSSELFALTIRPPPLHTS